MKRNENFWSYRLHKLGTPKVLRTDGQTDGRPDGRSGPTTRPDFAKATQVKKSTFQKNSHSNALESKFDLDVKYVKVNLGSSFEQTW